MARVPLLWALSPRSSDPHLRCYRTAASKQTNKQTNTYIRLYRGTFHASWKHHDKPARQYVSLRSVAPAPFSPQLPPAFTRVRSSPRPLRSFSRQFRSFSRQFRLVASQHSVLQILQLFHDGARQVVVHLLVEVLVDGVHLVLPELRGGAHQGFHVDGFLVQTLPRRGADTYIIDMLLLLM